jgi:hypothetical protein
LFGIFPNCTHTKIIVKTTCGKKEKKKAAQIETNVRALEFDAGLLARSQFASGRS